jgi:hypothetical protein
MLTRKAFLASAAAVVAPAARMRARRRPGQPRRAGQPERQFAWTQTLAHDRFGNPIQPRHHRLIFFDVGEPIRRGSVTGLEAALRRLEQTYPWGPEGLLFVLAWSPHYFEARLGVASPLPAPIPLASNESPKLDDYDACLHLACNSYARLAAVETALREPTPLPGSETRICVAEALRWRQTRTGFVGAGLPAQHQRARGIPRGGPVLRSAPMFMGFQSSYARNQAREDDVAISTGVFAAGTTMHVSLISLELMGWYETQTELQRVQAMYAPQATPSDIERVTDDPPTFVSRADEAVSQHGQIGHAQATALARRRGRPIILRRDFNSVDGGGAGLHFVSLQRQIGDFVQTRTAMNAASAQARNPQIQQTTNNGINGYMNVQRRGNYLVPPRSRRAFPLWELG